MEQESALSRVFEVADCKTQTELATLLGIRQSSIADAKRRNTIPAEWLVKLLRMKKVNPDWILTGRGAQYLAPAVEDNSNSTSVQDDAKYIQSYAAHELAAELVRRACA